MPIELGKTKKIISPPAAPAPKPLSPEEQKAVMEKATLEEERVYRRGVVTVRDIIAPASFQVTPNHLLLSGIYSRTLFVITYPRYIGLGWSASIINLNKTFDLAMYFYPVKANIILKQLQKRVGYLEAGLSMDADKGKPRDPLRETALRDIEGLRDALTQGTEHFFQFSFYLTIFAKSLDELDKLSGDIESEFGSKLIFSKKGFYQTEQGFNSTLPLCNDELMISYNMNTSPIAASFPFISSDLTSDNGILYGINRHNNSLILFDRFSLQNANTVVFATSGAGKSYMVKLEVLRALMMGTDVIIIDPEMEYKHLCDAVGGTYINISLASQSKVNPFDLPKPKGEEVKTEDIIRSAVITLKGLLRIMIGQPQGGAGVIGFTPEEDSLLDRALLEAYAKKDITPETVDLLLVESPILSDLIDVMQGMDGAEELVARLSKYTDGTFSGILNSPTTVETDNQLVIFSVRDLEDELRPMAIYTIVNHIWNTVRSERKKRILVIDEAWWLMQHEDSAKFIYALVKRCRKYYLGITTITQDVNDFLLSPYGQSIVTNSSMQFLLKQSPASVDLIQKTFNLTDGEKYLLLESGVGEGLFFAGQKHAAVKVVASYTEDQLVTTNPQQLLEIERGQKEFAAKMAGAESVTEPETPLLEEETPVVEESVVREEAGEAEAARIRKTLSDL
ncbi:MAG: Type IV secretory pathway VirB4 component-like protein [Candidatus Uhrbacteria bacterium GW2011_GWE2_45_35]|uniref:Type IV secretory pathway VirB4 component-like protein n=2 Tax=Candidatus Uhriibacteriota TaxID=1752732 RepID=A0A0G1JAI1_9BACT|nr:MAG: Type IV secretory pathway VirB4 component-like protein [Candidatus Uhrbacteria bacterium GW2011_GWF2_44_350]KKU08849.1 MAG: Type IV secretory pathway VirB4 component-like protein [Candidatus Uhrbacteria bacterium GW2011_GWE2_45_35]HBR80656.1 conjugal transfer protein TraC [Candidatus Uhrbacteria bacterium]HCU31862.1 conjugal transfer protein TraC [Candidatus Uhrbacteria bacterium]